MDAKTKEAIDLLRTLIATPSPSRDESRTAGLIFAYLAEHGAAPERLHNNVFARSAGFDPARPVPPPRITPPPLRPGEQRRRGFGGEPHADLPDAAHTPPAVQPPAGAFGRRGVHGRARYARPAAAAGTDRHGNRGGGPPSANGGWSSSTAKPAAKAAMRPATRASTRSISHSTTSPACVLSASTAAPTCWAPSASP